MKKRGVIITVAVVVAALAVAGLVLGLTLGKKGDGAIKGEGDCTVKFALPKEYEAFADAISMPEPVKVYAGTPVKSLDEADMDSCIFTNWYYDEERTLMAGPSDTVESDLTLYPSFTEKIGREDEFSLNYVSSLDVDENFTLDIAVYGLPQDKAESLILAKSVSLGGAEAEFILTPKEAPKEEADSAKKGEKVEIDGKEYYEEGYVPEGAEDAVGEEGDYAFRTIEDIDPEAAAAMAADGIDPATVTEKELRDYYGLSEDESVIRHVREDLGMDIESAFALQQILADNAAKRDATYYTLSAKDGKWDKASTYQIEITDTSRIRFVYDGEAVNEKVIYYNFTTHAEEMNNLTLNRGMVFIPYAEVQGVEMDNGLYSLVADDTEQIVSENSTAGTMIYAGQLAEGDVVAIYNGSLKDDGSVDGDVTYLKILACPEPSKYDYKSATFVDVVFMPDIIPIKDDGSFDDLTVTVAKADLDFSAEIYAGMGLDAGTSLDEGDFIAFYSGDIAEEETLKSAGYGRVTEITDNGDSLIVKYVAADKDDVTSAFDMYTAVDDVEIPVEEKQVEELKANAEKQMLESGFAEDVKDYVVSLLNGEEYDVESSEFSDELKNISFATDTGEEMSLEELQQLAGGGKKVKISDGPSVSVGISPKLQHFDGYGIRAEVRVGFTIEIELNSAGGKQNKIEIKLYAALEQEVVLGLDVKTSAKWKWYAFIPVLKEVNVSASIRAGTYTGLGGSVTVQTGSDAESKDTEWGKLISTTNNKTQKEADGLLKLGNKLEGFDKDLKTIQNGGNYSKTKGEKKGEFKHGDDDDGVQYQGVGGDLPTKYSGMLENDAEYINLVNYELFKLEASPDPLHLIDFSLEADFVVSLKINAMLGFGVSYGNAKQYCFNIAVFSGEKSTDNADLETPNFRADAYAFGMIGVRVGILLDARVGLISTEMDSIGITAEAGVYAEVYGFVYVSFTWESGKGTQKSAMGSLLFEVGAYLDINFVAQIGNEKLSKEVEIYSNTWPFVQLGADAVPMDFELEEDDEKLHVEVEEGKSTVKVPDEVFNINKMSLSSGELEAESEDSDETGSLAYNYTIRGREYSQYNEKRFSVTCFDLDGENGKVTSDHSFRYLPATNEIAVKPVDQNKDELWGIVTFTYRNNTFGFNTMEIQRNVYVHWKGKSASASVEYYMKNDAGKYDLIKEGEFNGFDGIEYDLVIDESFVHQFEGYRLVDVRFPDEGKMKDKADEYREIYNSTYKLYQKGRATKEQLDKASSDYNTAWSTYNNYGWNIVNTVKAQNGTLYFLMVSDETVVRLYFDPVVNGISWLSNLQERFSGGNRYLSVGVSQWTTLMMDKPILENMPDRMAKFAEERSRHKITWYYYLSDGPSDDSFKAIDNKDKWMELTPDVKMPDHYVTVIAVEEDADKYMLYWSDEGKIIDSVELQFGTPIPDHGIPFVEEGMWHDGWVDENGAMVYTMNAGTGGARVKMPDHDWTLYSHLAPNGYAVKVVYHGLNQTYTQTQYMVYGRNLLNEINGVRAYESKEGYTLNWYVVGDNGAKTLIEPALTMPPYEITVEGSFEANRYNVTYVRDGVTTTETRAFGEKINLSADNNYLWTESGVAVKGDFTVPARDVTLIGTYHDHDWSETRRDPAYCYREGTAYYACTLCGATRTESLPIDPTNHGATERGRNYKAPTCGSDGYSGDVVCIDCNTTIETGTVLPATGIHEMWECLDSKPATCTETGYYHANCMYCDYEEKTVLPIDPKNHPQYVEIDGRTYDSELPGVDAFAPTCTSFGHTGKTVCRACGATLEEGEMIPALGHDLKEYKYTPATCSTLGERKYYCTRCIYEESRPVAIDPDNHEDIETDVGQADATCISKGYTGDTVCHACDKVIAYGTETPVNPERHTRFTYEVGKIEATCTAEGFTGNTECADCGYSFENGHVTAMVAHKYGDFKTVTPATALEEGWEERVCSECLKIDGRAIPKLNVEVYTITLVDWFAIDEMPMICPTEEQLVWDGEGSDTTIKACPFTHTGYYLENWYCVVEDGEGDYEIVHFNPEAAIVWEEPASNEGDVIYLPALDTDGDHVIKITSTYSRLSYPVIKYINNGTDNTLNQNDVVLYGTESRFYMMELDASLNPGKTHVGWSTSPDGPAEFGINVYATVPSYDEMIGKTYILYAIWE